MTRDTSRSNPRTPGRTRATGRPAPGRTASRFLAGSPAPTDSRPNSWDTRCPVIRTPGTRPSRVTTMRTRLMLATPVTPATASLRRSTMGLVSFVFGLISGIGLTVLVVMAGVMTAQAGGRMDETSPEAITLGVLLILGMFLALIGAILGIVALMQKGHKKLFGILGLVFNGGILLLVLALMVLGLSMKS